LKELRDAQRNALEEQFEKVDGLGDYAQGGEGAGELDGNNNSQFVYNQQEENPPKGKGSSKKVNQKQQQQKKNNYEEEDNNYDQYQNNQNNQQQQQQEQNMMGSYEKEAASCGFCGYFDPNFDETSLALHCFKECPMVILTFNN
jgi:hypothetical protein